MHLITPLISGVAGAENGTVHFYRRGAAGTYVTYYTSFEGDGGTTPTGAVTLDSNGGGTFYVNEETLCVVNDSDGVTVRSFVAGVGAPSVEVISQSFTGTDYASAQTGVSKPVTLADILDLWKTNAGATDWKVPIGGVPTTLSNAFATVGAAFINVKAALYGAVGDGAANDTAAVQAALDAASALGGGTVFFPAGSYRTTAALTVAANVSLLGAGPAVSILKIAHATANLLTLALAITSLSSIEGLRLTCAQSSTGTLVNAALGRKLRIHNCSIGQTTGLNGAVTGVKYDVAGSNIFITNTAFTLDGNGGSAVKAATTTVANIAHIWGCEVSFNAATHGGVVFDLSCGTVLGTTINCAGLTGGCDVATFGNVTDGLVQAFAFNTVTNPTSGTVTVPTGLPATSALLTQFAEFGNKFGTSVVVQESGGTMAKSTYFQQHSLHRETGRYYVASNAAAVTIEPTKYRTIEIERTDTAAQQINVDPVAGSATLYGVSGIDYALVYNNLANASVTGTITMNSATTRGLTTFTVNANSYSIYFFRCLHVDVVSRWYLMGSVVNQVS